MPGPCARGGRDVCMCTCVCLCVHVYTCACVLKDRIIAISEGFALISRLPALPLDAIPAFCPPEGLAHTGSWKPPWLREPQTLQRRLGPELSAWLSLSLSLSSVPAINANPIFWDQMKQPYAKGLGWLF